MIEARDILADFRSQLARQIAGRNQLPAFAPLATTSWIASSLLQKSIRRGRSDFALRAAATLLVNAPDRFWKRCGGIAFEDIGVADPEAVGLVAAALGGKRARASLGGEWSVASFIVEMMSAARKCRAADDLLMSIELHPALAEARRAHVELSIHHLRRIVLSTAPLNERALALCYMLGTDRRPSRHLPARRGEPAFVFDVLDELGTPLTMVEIAREGFRRTREALCPLVGLLIVCGERCTGVVDDEFPLEAMIGPVPSWALDQYTREGRAALARFLRTDCRTARQLCSQVSFGRRIEVLGGLVFRAEGGLLMKRLRWPLGNELRQLVDIECHGPDVPDPAELLDLLRTDLPVLNRVRAEVMGGIQHVR